MGSAASLGPFVAFASPALPAPLTPLPSLVCPASLALAAPQPYNSAGSEQPEGPGPGPAAVETTLATVFDGTLSSLLSEVHPERFRMYGQ